MVEDIIFPGEWNYVSLILVYIIYVNDCFKFKRYHVLERRNQQNFVLKLSFELKLSFDYFQCFEAS